VSTVKVSELPVLASADAADEFVVVDDSAGVTKKITQAGLANFGSNALTAGTVTASGLVTASSGITFGSDTLDDYEEGTFVPSLFFGGSDSGAVYNSSFRQGVYTLIGRVCFFQIRLLVTTAPSTTGQATMNLPFTSASLGTEYFVSFSTNQSTFSSNAGTMAIPAGQNFIGFSDNTFGGASNDSDFGSSNIRISLNGAYRIS